MEKYYVVKGTELYKKVSNIWEYVYTYNSNEFKICDKIEDAISYYNNLKLNNSIENDFKYSDYKSIYKYDSLYINDSDIIDNTYDTDLMSLYQDMYLS